MYNDSYAKDANMKVKYAIQTRQNLVHMTNHLLEEQEERDKWAIQTRENLVHMTNDLLEEQEEREELEERDNQIYNWMDECNYYKKPFDYECFQGGCDNECGCDCCSDFDDEHEVFYE